MNLEKCRKTADTFSSKTSEVVRNLGFAGIALIWLFRAEINGNYVIPSKLIIAGILIVNGLGLDLLHCIIPTAIWSGFARIKEVRGVEKDNEFLVPRWFNWPTNVFFWGKIILILSAYYFLLEFLWDRLI